MTAKTTTKPARITLNSGDAGHYMATRQPFTCNGNFTGEVGNAWTYGQLPEPFRSEYKAAEDAGQVAYTVSSYYTPIGWVLTSGEVIIPEVKYSSTTSRHQGIVRLNLR